MSLFLAAASCGSAAAPAWDPSLITGVLSYWDTRGPNTVVGGKYELIADLVGSGADRSFQQLNAAIQPVQSLADPAWNNQEVASFTGTQQMTTVNPVGAMTATSWTVFLVVSFTGAPGYSPAFDTASGPPSSAIVRGAGGNLEVTNAATVDTGYALDTNPHLIVAEFNATSGKYNTYVDGVNVSSAAAVVTDPWAGVAAVLGRDRGPFGNLTGKFGSGGIVDGVMSGGDSALLLTWSQTEWGTP